MYQITSQCLVSRDSRTASCRRPAVATLPYPWCLATTFTVALCVPQAAAPPTYHWTVGPVLLGDYPGESTTVPWTSPWSWFWIGTLTLTTGLLIAVASPRRRPSIPASLESVAPHDYRSVAGAVRAGTVPSDPAIREAAAQLTGVQSRGINGLRRWMEF